MDPRDRADALLARARARGAFVVTPENATSPMDSSNTQQIPRSMVSDIDHDQDPDTTTQLPASLIAENDHHLASGQPTTPMEVDGGRRQQPPAPSAQRSEPAAVDGVKKEEHVGLVPTTTQTSGLSNLSRRLEGL